MEGLGAAAAGGAGPATDVPVDELVSELPDGFGELELLAQCSLIKCSASLPDSGPEDAVHELCAFFGRAPASYQRFSVS